MIRYVLALLLCCIPYTLLAESLPAFYDVTNVEATDVLNVRDAPNTSASILGTLTPTATRIEVVGIDPTNSWARINLQGKSGWVSLAFLQRQPGQPEDRLSKPLNCFGNEPFWAVALSEGDTAELTKPGEPTLLFENLYTVDAANRSDRHAVFGQGEESVFTMVFHRDQCTDTMSDRLFGISVDVFLTGSRDVNYVTGCCSLVP